MTTFYPNTHSIQEALGQEISGENIAISDVHFDSRDVTAGSLYVALTHEKWDGHDHAIDAVTRGATALLVQQKMDVPAHVAQIIVPSTNNAFDALARYARAHYKGKVIALTGSTGKTTCKEFLKHLLSTADAPAHANIGNLNNTIGAPLTLLRLPPEAPYAIFELGMNVPGEIAPLSRLVQPHMAIVLNTLPVHTQGVGGLGGVVKEKLAITAGLNVDGALLLNANIPTDEHLDFAGKVITFGEGSENILTGKNAANIMGKEVSFPLENATTPRQFNALAALLAARIIGENLTDIAQRLAAAETPNGRGNSVDVSGITLINDSYNANPESIKAALESLRQRDVTGKRYALLGDMRELGAGEEQYHTDLAPHCHGLDGIFTCGHLMKHLADALPEALLLQHFDNVSEIDYTAIITHLKPQDALLVKGSNGIFYQSNSVQKLTQLLEEAHV